MKTIYEILENWENEGQKPSETENAWFYRCVLMNTSDAKKWLENIDR